MKKLHVAGFPLRECLAFLSSFNSVDDKKIEEISIDNCLLDDREANIETTLFHDLFHFFLPMSKVDSEATYCFWQTNRRRAPKFRHMTEIEIEKKMEKSKNDISRVFINKYKKQQSNVNKLSNNNCNPFEANTNIKMISITHCNDITLARYPQMVTELENTSSKRIEKGLRNLKALCWKSGHYKIGAGNIFSLICCKILNTIGCQLESLHLADTDEGNKGWIFWQKACAAMDKKSAKATTNTKAKAKANTTDDDDDGKDNFFNDSIINKNDIKQKWYPINVKELCIEEPQSDCGRFSGSQMLPDQSHIIEYISQCYFPHLERMHIRTSVCDIHHRNLASNLNKMIKNGLHSLSFDFTSLIWDFNELAANGTFHFFENLNNLFKNCQNNLCKNRDFILKVGINVELFPDRDEHNVHDDDGYQNIEDMFLNDAFVFGFEEIVELFEEMKKCFDHIMLGVKFRFAVSLDQIIVDKIDMDDIAYVIKHQRLAEFVTVCSKNANIEFDCNMSTKKQNSEIILSMILKDKDEGNDMCYMEPVFDYSCKCCRSKPYLNYY